jgi:UPF0755 protein
MRRKINRTWLYVAGAAVVTAAGAYGWLFSNLGTAEGAKTSYVRFDERLTVDEAIGRLKESNLIANADAFRLYARFFRHSRIVAPGTYRVRLNKGPDALLTSLQQPLVQMVRLPETNWASRNAILLEKADVCDAEEYMRLVRQPKLFQSDVSFPLPAKSLEGYLYPDTYDFPPLLGAKAVIKRQLANFEKRVWMGLGQPMDLDRYVKIGSLVELETKLEDEKPIVAGVIENRLRKGMRLQIDASINYGLQKWRPLLRSEYQSVISPYNLYRVEGLPPTPICSPTVESIRAAMNPAVHNNLYYVALPSGESLFSATYDEHRQNIKRRKEAMAALISSQSGMSNKATQ